VVGCSVFLIADVVGDVVGNVVGKLAPQISLKFAVYLWPPFLPTTLPPAAASNTSGLM